MPELDELVYERTPGWAEGWVRVSLERRPDGARVVIEGHDYCYLLRPDLHVLCGVTDAMERITPSELASGLAEIGPAGRRLLARLSWPGSSPVVA